MGRAEPKHWIVPVRPGARRAGAVVGRILVSSLLAATPWTRAEVRLSELVASTSQRLLERDDHGRLRPGTGPHWVDAGFAEIGWQRGAAPLGFGGSAGLRTNVAGILSKNTESHEGTAAT